MAINPASTMNLRRFYPLNGFPQQRQIWSWISFDVANQSFTLIINTLLFSIFFSKVVMQNDAIDDRVWALTYGGSMLLTAILSPLAGAAADERCWKKRFLICVRADVRDFHLRSWLRPTGTDLAGGPALRAGELRVLDR